MSLNISMTAAIKAADSKASCEFRKREEKRRHGVVISVYFKGSEYNRMGVKRNLCIVSPSLSPFLTFFQITLYQQD